MQVYQELLFSNRDTSPPPVGRKTFGRLSRVWRNGKIRTSTKFRILNTCVLPVLLYGSDTWTLSASTTRRVDAYHRTCLRNILGIRWYHPGTNKDLRQSGKSQPAVRHHQAAKDQAARTCCATWRGSAGQEDPPRGDSSSSGRLAPPCGTSSFNLGLSGFGCPPASGPRRRRGQPPGI